MPKPHRQRQWVEFCNGCLEGMAGGLVFGFLTGGIGFVAIPILAFLQGLNRLQNAYFFQKRIKKVVENSEVNLYSVNTFVQGVVGLLIGAGAGALYGFGIGAFFAPFTFGLSILFLTLIGAGVGAVSSIFHIMDDYHSVKKLCSPQTSIAVVKKKLNVWDNAKLGLLIGLTIGVALAPLTGGLSILIAPAVITVFSCIITYNTSYSLNPRRLSSAESISTSTLTSVGAMVGSAIGLALAPVTGGLSILLGALIGASIGFLVGKYSDIFIPVAQPIAEKLEEFANKNSEIGGGSTYGYVKEFNQDASLLHKSDKIDHAAFTEIPTPTELPTQQPEVESVVSDYEYQSRYSRS